VVKLHPRRIGQHGLEVRRIIARTRAEADEMLVPAAVRNLDHAEPVTRGDQAHGFGIDRDRTGAECPCRKVFLMEMDCHKGLLRRIDLPMEGPKGARWRA